MWPGGWGHQRRSRFFDSIREAGFGWIEDQTKTASRVPLCPSGQVVQRLADECLAGRFFPEALLPSLTASEDVAGGDVIRSLRRMSAL